VSNHKLTYLPFDELNGVLLVEHTSMQPWSTAPSVTKRPAVLLVTVIV